MMLYKFCTIRSFNVSLVVKPIQLLWESAYRRSNASK